MYLRFLICIFFLIFFCAFTGKANNFASIVFDEKSGKIIHQEKAEEIRHPASLTKKMTLFLLFEALESGRIGFGTKFKVSRLATMQMPCKLGLKSGSYITVSDIIKALITRSANDVAVVAAEGLAGSVQSFVSMMNRKAKILGMTSTRFFNPSGVPDKRQVTTAKDMLILARALHNQFPNYYHYFKLKKFHYMGQEIRTHNKLLNFPHIDGLKTGYTCASGYNISTSAVNFVKNGEKRRLFVVVMGGNTARSRDAKVMYLLNKYFSLNPELTQVSNTQETNIQFLDYKSKDLEKIIDDIEKPQIKNNSKDTQRTQVPEKQKYSIDEIIFNIDESGRRLPEGWQVNVPDKKEKITKRNLSKIKKIRKNIHKKTKLKKV